MKQNKNRSPKSDLNNDSGFTLVEIIAVLTILGIIGSLAVGKVIALDTSAVQKSFQWSVSELNSREQLTWSKVKLSTTNRVADDQIFARLDDDLGPAYSWSSKSIAGGVLHFKGQQIELRRSPSTAAHPGSWTSR